MTAVSVATTAAESPPPDGPPLASSSGPPPGGIDELAARRRPGRVPPANVVAEESVVGAMLLSRDAVAAAVEVLTVEHFYDQGNAAVFEAVSGLFSAGDPVDVVTVEHALTREGKLGLVGGVERLLALAAATPTAAHVGRYARMVEDAALLRQLASVAAEIADTAYSSPADVAAAIDEAESKVFQVAERRIADTTSSLSDNISRLLDRLEERYANGDAVTGVSTGFRDIDKLTAGLQPSNLVVIGARPAMGKTALALGIATHVAVREQRPVLFCSLEMDHLELTTRLIAAETRLNAQQLSTGELSERDWAVVNDSLDRIASAPMWIDDNPNLTVAEVRAKARRLANRAGGLGLVVVDYLQLMSGRNNAENRQVEVAEMSRSLKVLARELATPVIALSQLSRNLEQRADKHPMLSDLRESGSIEQDADVVMFLYRDEVYHPDSTDKGLAEIHIAKHRNGPTGHTKLVWLPESTKFADPAPAGAHPHR